MLARRVSCSRRSASIVASSSRRSSSSGGKAASKTKARKAKAKVEEAKGGGEHRQAVLHELEEVKRVTERARRRRGIALQKDLPLPPLPPSLEAEVAAARYPGGPGRPPKGAVELLTKEDLYLQIAEVRKRMSRKLSEANLYVRHLEVDLLKRDGEIAAHHEKLSLIEKEFEHVLSTARELREAGERGHGGQTSVEQSSRLRILEKSVEDLSRRIKGETEALSYIKKVAVEISWLGSAEDVKLMGSFDGWTRGEQLSPRDIAGGGIAEFVGEILLRPGVYEVKFLVDGQWRLVPEWPTSGSDPVSSNNILVVE